VKSLIALGLFAPFVLLATAPVPQSIAQVAQAKAAAAAFKVEELDQLMAPIALYPDELLAQVLTAATYPLEVVMAARWVAEPKNAKLKGNALDKALQAQGWDPSIKSLVPFPSVLKLMSDRLDWARKVGDAFLAQQKDCLASVQRLRQRAMAAGKLGSTAQQKVTTEGQTIIIQPANPQIVYVPAYNPTIVYGAWPYPSYPPYYYPPPSGYAFATGMAIGFAVGVAVNNNNYWGWGRPNWQAGDININVNRWNQINANRTTIAGNTWQHNSVHREGVTYRDAATRQRYGQQHSGAQARRQYRGHQNQAARPGTLQARAPGAALAQRPAPAAFNPGSGASARAASARGQFSRRQMGAVGGRSFGGAAGGGRRGGGFRR
jgi:Protein of unknown function (DUF3300)